MTDGWRTASNPAVLAGLIARDTEVEHVRRVIARARLEAGDNSDEAVEMAMDMLVSHRSHHVLGHLLYFTDLSGGFFV